MLTVVPGEDNDLTQIRCSCSDLCSGYILMIDSLSYFLLILTFLHNPRTSIPPNKSDNRRKYLYNPYNL